MRRRAARIWWAAVLVISLSAGGLMLAGWWADRPPADAGVIPLDAAPVTVPVVPLDEVPQERDQVELALVPDESPLAMVISDRDTVSATMPAPRVDAPPPAVTTHSLRLEPLVRPRPIRPVALSVDDGLIESAVVPVGLDGQTLEMTLPAEAGVVAWYQLGPTPGDAGSAVLAGHVDYNRQRGAFYQLRNVDLGARVRVRYDDGSDREFVVEARRHYAKDELPRDEIFRRDGSATLVLITCAGNFDRVTHSYDDNLVVYATPVT